VVLVGHSLGSTIVALAAARYDGIDGVVLTGLLHRFDPVDTVALFTRGFAPAASDPKFADRGLDPGYLTTVPGARARFFTAPTTEPDVLAAEELTRGVFPATDVPDAGVLVELLPTTRFIDVPVLLAVGGADRIMCGTPPTGTDCSSAATVRSAEAPWFSAAARLQVFVLPEAGHSLTTAPGTLHYQRAVIDWAHSYVEADGDAR
jgi:pimeloyl-ACP methyl ester carboxylesterase